MLRDYCNISNFMIEQLFNLIDIYHNFIAQMHDYILYFIICYVPCYFKYAPTPLPAYLYASYTNTTQTLDRHILF